MTTMDQALGFFKSLRQQDKDIEATRQDHRDFLFRNVQEGRLQKKQRFDVLKSELDKENAGIKYNLENYDKIILPLTGARRDAAISSKNSYAGSLSPYHKNRFSSFIDLSPTGKDQLALYAYDEAHPKKPPPWIKKDSDGKPDDSKEGGEDQPVSLLVKANYLLDEKDRTVGREAIRTGKASTGNPVVKIDDDYYATRDDSGMPNIVSVKEYGLGQQAESLGLEMSDLNGGNFEKSVMVNTPYGQMQHVYQYAAKGLFTPKQLSDGKYTKDAMGNRFRVDVRPSKEMGDETRAAMVKNNRLVQDVIRDYSRSTDSKAFERLDEEDTRSAKIVQAFHNDLDNSGDEEFALDQMNRQTGGVWTIVGDKPGDQKWNTNWISEASYIRGDKQTLLHLPGSWQGFISQDGAHTSLYVNPQGHVMDFDRLNEAIFDKSKGVNGVWYESIEKANEAISSSNYADLDFLDKAGKSLEAHAVRPDRGGLIEPEDPLGMSDKVPPMTTTRRAEKAAAKKARQLPATVPEDIAKFPEHARTYRLISDGLGGASDAAKRKAFDALNELSDATTKTIAKMALSVFRPGGKFRANVFEDKVAKEQFRKQVNQFMTAGQGQFRSGVFEDKLSKAEFNRSLKEVEEYFKYLIDPFIEERLNAPTGISRR